MKTAIYYFSATGNSLAVARDLASSIGEAELIPITKALKSGAALQHDCIGIVFPVYMFGLPLVVCEFLREIKFPKEAYIFAVGTFGGLPGRPFALARQILKLRGINLASAFGVRMPGNYTPLYGAISQEEQKQMFMKEAEEIRYIAGAVREKKTKVYENKPLILNFLLYALLYRLGSSRIHKECSNFWVTGQCTECGLCSKVCPVVNIKLQDGKPVWLDHCEHCMACLQWCPVEAIQYKKSTEGRKRYHHPEIKAEDIMKQQP